MIDDLKSVSEYNLFHQLRLNLTIQQKSSSKLRQPWSRRSQRLRTCLMFLIQLFQKKRFSLENSTTGIRVFVPSLKDKKQ
jgi:hypothetical protein